MIKKTSYAWEAHSFSIFDRKGNVAIHEKLDFPVTVTPADAIRIEVFQKKGTLKTLSMPKRIMELKRQRQKLQRQLNKVLDTLDRGYE